MGHYQYRESWFPSDKKDVLPTNNLQEDSSFWGTRHRLASGERVTVKGSRAQQNLGDLHGPCSPPAPLSSPGPRWQCHPASLALAARSPPPPRLSPQPCRRCLPCQARLGCLLVLGSWSLCFTSSSLLPSLPWLMQRAGPISCSWRTARIVLSAEALGKPANKHANKQKPNEATKQEKPQPSSRGLRSMHPSSSSSSSFHLLTQRWRDTPQGVCLGKGAVCHSAPPSPQGALDQWCWG